MTASLTISDAAGDSWELLTAGTHSVRLASAAIVGEGTQTQLVVRVRDANDAEYSVFRTRNIERLAKRAGYGARVNDMIGKAENGRSRTYFNITLVTSKDGEYLNLA